MIARDKDHANFFLKSMGYPVVPGSKTFFSREWARSVGHPERDIDGAYQYARKMGFPVVVKPNSGMQGLGVSLVHNRRDFYKAMRVVFKMDRVALVQQVVYGRDYRLVVFGNKLISAYHRIPLNIVGDGKSTIADLVKEKLRKWNVKGRRAKVDVDDPRIAIKLDRQGLGFHSVPAKRRMVYLLDNANLSQGGDSVDVTREIHPEFRKLAVRLTRDMGLRFCGVDLIVQGDIRQAPGVFWVIEVNSSPGLHHYSKMGKVQQKVVDDLYSKVLLSLDTK